MSVAIEMRACVCLGDDCPTDLSERVPSSDRGGRPSVLLDALKGLTRAASVVPINRKRVCVCVCVCYLSFRFGALLFFLCVDALDFEAFRSSLTCRETEESNREGPSVALVASFIKK